MSMKVRVIILLIGLALIIFRISMEIFGGNNVPHPEGYEIIALYLFFFSPDFFVLLAGIILVVMKSQRKKEFGMIFSGIFISLLGAGGLYAVFSGEVSGFGIYGIIPVPFELIAPLVTVFGLVIAISGIIGLFKSDPKV